MSDKKNTLEWGKQYLQSKGYSIKETQVVIETPWSLVIRYVTQKGDFYLKKTPPDLFIEPEVIKVIQNNLSDSATPTILAQDESSHCYIMKSCGDQSLRSLFNGKLDAKLLITGLQHYFKILRSFENNQATLEKIGVPDWRLNRLPHLYVELLEKKTLLLNEGVTHTEIDKLKKLTSKIELICEFLNQQKVRETLVNADFNESNMIMTDSNEKIAFIDWGESVIAHPFFTITSHLRSLARRYQLEISSPLLEGIRKNCLECWLDRADLQALEIIYEQILRLSPLFSVLAIERLQLATQNKSKEKQNWFIAGFLRMLLESESND
ncbi:MAG: phosphotransferase [Candidatus Berkiella sp.]